MSASMDVTESRVVCKEGTGNQEVIRGFKNVNDYTQECFKRILQATKKSNDLPTPGDDFDFISSFGNFQELLNMEGRRILHIIQNILRYENVRGDRSLTNETLDLEDKFEYLTDANDQMLERIEMLLDEASGMKTENKLIVVSSNKPASSSLWNKQSQRTDTKSVTFSLVSARNITRPQLSFSRPICNDNTPFCPQLTEKPNALLSLEESMKVPEGCIDKDLSSPSSFMHPHPYQYELERFEPPLHQLTKTTPMPPPPCSDSPDLVMVDTPQQLDIVIRDLSHQATIAVDLENHSYRTFLGFTCLIQISTPYQDYIIDALKLRSHLHYLNSVFTDPGILKVFHGANSDIQWLQRDFSVYVVNMFDTGIAARLLSYPRLSLSYLLEKLCGVHANKFYQRADWRIRPIPEELLNYAREDTHYLLYIEQCLRNELIDRSNDQSNLILSLYQASTQRCLLKYEKFLFTEQPYLEAYRKSRKVFNTQQLFAFQNLFSWRDRMARSEDESTGYVLPAHMMLQIAEILPREAAGVLACCNPVPPLVRQSLNEIHSIILKAREIKLISVGSVSQVPQAPIRSETIISSPSPVHSLVGSCHDSTPRSQSHHYHCDQSPTTDKIVPATSRQLFPEICPSAEDISNIVVKPSPILFSLISKSNRGKSAALRDLADKITSDFVSPLTMYLPERSAASALYSTIAASPSKSKQTPQPVWRMKMSKKRKSEEPPPISNIDEIPSTSVGVVQATMGTEQSGLVSLSEMFPHKKKKKKTDWLKYSKPATNDEPMQEEVLGQDITTTPMVATQQKHKLQPIDPSLVLPYNYSAAKLSWFSKNPQKSSKHYDPREKTKKSKKGPKSKTFKKDCQSKTFKTGFKEI